MVHELTEGLLERGHDVTLFATGDSRNDAELRFLYPHGQWPPSLLPDVNHVTWALQQVQRERFDVVHAHSAVALAVARFCPNLPLVYTIHHVREDELSRFYSCFREPFYVAISAAQAEREVALARLAVIHHGLNPACYQVVDVPAEYVCFIGRFARIKGSHTAIDVAAAASVPIRVAGEAHEPERDFAAREMAPRLAMPHVTFMGSIGTGEKVPLLRDARALLQPLNWEEPFGLVMIEAMLSGCPVVALPRGSVREIIEHGVTGFIVRNEREMVECIRPGGAVERFDRAQCRSVATQRFSRARMAADYERLYVRAHGGARAAGQARSLPFEHRRRPDPAAR